MGWKYAFCEGKRTLGCRTAKIRFQISKAYSVNKRGKIRLPLGKTYFGRRRLHKKETARATDGRAPPGSLFSLPSPASPVVTTNRGGSPARGCRRGRGGRSSAARPRPPGGLQASGGAAHFRSRRPRDGRGVRGCGRGGRRPRAYGRSARLRRGAARGAVRRRGRVRAARIGDEASGGYCDRGGGRRPPARK